MPIKTIQTCDACESPIGDHHIAFVPLRGGLSIHVSTPEGNASQVIAQKVTLCNANCVNAWLNKIKPAPKPAPQPSNPE